MKKRTANILFVLLIVSVIIFMLWFIIWLKSESKDCIVNQLQYFYEKNPEIDCTCFKDGVIVQGLSNEREFVYDIQP